MKPVVFLAMLAMSFLRGGELVKVRWTETPGLFAGRTAVVTLKSGNRIEGDWLSATADGFTILSHGQRREFARTDATRFGLRQKRIRGRVLGTLAGVYGVGIIGAYASREPLALVPSAVAGGILGYFLGRANDRRLIEIEIED